MTARYTPPTIREIGFKNHLENTRDQHNGRGYDDWVRYMTTKNEFGKDYRKQDIVDAFGITWRTFYSWFTVWEAEHDDSQVST